MPFQTDESLARDVRKTFGEYVATFTSGLDPASVTDRYVSELWNCAGERGIADNFEVILS
jgi:hypothetical protein